MMLQLYVHRHASTEKEIDDVLVTELASPRKTINHLLLGRRRLQPSVVGKEGLHNIKSSNSRSAFEVELRTAICKKLSGVTTTVPESTVHLAAAVWSVDDRTVIHQQSHQWQLNAGF